VERRHRCEAALAVVDAVERFSVPAANMAVQKRNQYRLQTKMRSLYPQRGVRVNAAFAECAYRTTSD